MYDVSIWEEIRPSVQSQTNRLIDTVRNQVATDSCLAEFRGETLPWQFGTVLQQRANSWVQKLYEICGQARDATGKPRSPEFNWSIWAYCIEPFVLGGTPEPGTYAKSPLLNLLFHAIKGEPNPPGGLALGQRDLCLNIRNKVWETWRAKLLGIPSRREQAAAAWARHNAMQMQASARSLVDGLSEQSPSSTESSSREGPGQPVTDQQVVKQTPAGVDTPPAACSESKIPIMQVLSWQDIEIRFLSDHRVEIRTGPKIETRNYGEFGFEDRRSGKPIEAWITLCELAQKEGVIKNAAHSQGDWPRVEKHMQQIRKILQTHFQITSEPLPFIRGVGYRAAFKISCAPSFRF